MKMLFSDVLRIRVIEPMMDAADRFLLRLVFNETPESVREQQDEASQRHLDRMTQEHRKRIAEDNARFRAAGAAK